MSEIEIRSDSSHFEEKDLIISLAQRSLAKYLGKQNSNTCRWINEYREDIYYSSWNNTFKTFCLESREGFFSRDKRERYDVLRRTISLIIADLKMMSPEEFFRAIVEPIDLDESTGLGSHESVVDNFLPQFHLEGVESEKILHRVISVLEKVSGIIQ
jgi:hypothetical protein